MKKTKLALATSAVVGLSSVAYQGARAGSATTSATADLVKDIVVTKVQNMAFGNLLSNFGTGTAAATKETVKFNAAGTALVAGTDVTHVDGIVQPAKFNLSTDTDAATGQSITVQAVALGHATGTHTLPWRSLKADYTAKSVSAAQTIGTGLTATITNASVPTTGQTLDAYGGIEVEASDAIGSYSGTVTVTANRQ